MSFYIGMTRRDLFHLYFTSVLSARFILHFLGKRGKHVPCDLEIVSKNYHLQKMIAFDDR